MDHPLPDVPGRWLLIRGLSRDQRHWGEFPEQLGSALGAEIETIDPPGFGTQAGRPSPTTIQAITDDMRRRFDRGSSGQSLGIIGISLGGMVALDWCVRHGADFRRCVVINTSAANVSPPHHRFSLGTLPVLLGNRRRSPFEAERAVLGATVNRSDLDLDSLARRHAGWHADLPPHPKAVRSQSIAAVRFRLPARIGVPLLVLTSRGDRLVSSQCSQRIAARLHAPIRVHATGGHDLPLDDPDWIGDEIRSWLEG